MTYNLEDCKGSKIACKNHTEWLEIKHCAIGGSEIGAVCNLSPFATPYKVWKSKTNPLIIEEDNNAMWWGRELEDVVAKRFEFETGKKVQRDNHTFIDKEYSFFIANVDRKVVGEDAILECKTTNSMNTKAWEDNKIPDTYYAQLQWYLGVTGYKKAYIACLIGDKTTVIRECDRNEDYIALLRKIGYEFWTVNVLGNIPPQATADDLPTLYEDYPINDEIIVIDENEELDAMIKKRAEYDLEIENLKLYKDLRDDLDARIIQLMKGTQKIISPTYEITNKVTVRESIDSTKLKAEYPDIAKLCTKKSQSKNFKIKKL